MDIKMLKQTYYGGMARKVGEVHEDLDAETISRWVKNGIAEVVEYESISAEKDANSPDKMADVFPVNEEECENVGCDYAGEVEEPKVVEEPSDELSAKDLFILCKDRGLKPKAKMKREYYLGLLEQEV